MTTTTRKIVINPSTGGFGLSERATKLLADHFGTTEFEVDDDIYNEEYTKGPKGTFQVRRDCPELVRIVETLGDAANTAYSDLQIVNIPADVEWTILKNHGGVEYAAEKKCEKIMDEKLAAMKSNADEDGSIEPFRVWTRVVYNKTGPATEEEIIDNVWEAAFYANR
jgi:hypothetical protein